MCRKDCSITRPPSAGAGIGFAAEAAGAAACVQGWPFLPVAMVSTADGDKLRAYMLRTPVVTGRILPSTYKQAAAPIVWAGSSRGPAMGNNSKELPLLKPDILAPGVDILMAADPAVQGQAFKLSMGEATHVASWMHAAAPSWEGTCMPACCQDGLCPRRMTQALLHLQEQVLLRRMPAALRCSSNRSTPPGQLPWSSLR
jgi:hypothetical protein